MKKDISFILIISLILLSCGLRPVNKKPYEIFVDKVKCDATILCDDNSLINLSIRKDTFQGKQVNWLNCTLSFYRRTNDSLYLYFPEQHSPEYRRIKTRHFYYDTMPSDLGICVSPDIEKFADSVFQKHTEYFGQVVVYIPKATAVIKNGAVIF